MANIPMIVVRRGMILFVVLLFSIASAQAAEHLVENPRAFAEAQSRLQPGDQLVLKNGPWKDAALRFRAEGTQAQPITLRAETPGQVVFTGQSQLRFSGRHLIVSGLVFRDVDPRDDVVLFRTDSDELAEDCRLTDCLFERCNPPSKRNTRYLSIYGTRNRVDHCAFLGKDSPGTTVVVWLHGTPNEHRLEFNHFGPRPALRANGGEMLRLGDSKTSLQISKSVVASNLFEECNGEAEIITNKSCENVYRHNTFLRCSGALTLRHGHRCEVAGNFFLGDGAKGTGGVRIIGEDHRVFNNYFEKLTGDEARSAISLMNGLANSPLNGYSPVKNALVAFNTFVDCEHPFTIGLSDEDADNTIAPCESLIGWNVVRGRHAVVETLTAPRALTWRGNISFGSRLGLADPTGWTELDPGLIAGADRIFRLGPQSPLRGLVREELPWLRDDLDGQPRIPQPGLDPGADQFSDAPVTNRPLSQTDVGPTWRRVGPVK